jgi:hypothetical protein
MLPTELVSKIMLFHSNIRFDKNELIDFVADWTEMKTLDNWSLEDDRNPTEEEATRMEELYEKPLIKKFYDRLLGPEIPFPPNDWTPIDWTPPIPPVD